MILIIEEGVLIALLAFGIFWAGSKVYRGTKSQDSALENSGLKQVYDSVAIPPVDSDARSIVKNVTVDQIVLADYNQSK